MFLIHMSIRFAFVVRSAENPRNTFVSMFKELLLIEGRLLWLYIESVGGGVCMYIHNDWD